MPTVIIEGYKFRFYSTDIREPPHYHVLRDNKVAKIWLASFIVERNIGYRDAELNKIVRLTRENHDLLLEVWNDYFRR
ncbi:MAG: DUF4160 domain-containing protein [Chloroflexi bacterium]|nr:DUF4160 domain-containing protein [Chloroflexota bacterium]